MSCSCAFPPGSCLICDTYLVNNCTLTLTDVTFIIRIDASLDNCNAIDTLWIGGTDVSITGSVIGEILSVIINTLTNTFGFLTQLIFNFITSFLDISLPTGNLLCTLAGRSDMLPIPPETFPTILPGPLINDTAGQISFNIVNYNIYSFPYFLFFHGQNERLARIPMKLSQIDFDIGLDVVTINELWTSNFDDVFKKSATYYEPFVNMMLQNWPYYYVSPPTETPNGILNNGLAIFSKHPIIDSGCFFYNECNFEDCLANKGALYVKILKQKYNSSEYININIITTHPGAGNIQEIQDVRGVQFTDLANWITNTLKLPSDEPLIIDGDMNMNQFNKASFPGPTSFASSVDNSLPISGEYQFLLSVLNATSPEITDDKGNPCVLGSNATSIPNNGLSYYQNNCLSSWGDSNSQVPWTVCNNLDFEGPVGATPNMNEWLDSILYSNAGLQPLSSNVYTSMIMSEVGIVPSAIWAIDSFASKADAEQNVVSLNDLSDHHPLVGKFIFPSSIQVNTTTAP